MCNKEIDIYHTPRKNLVRGITSLALAASLNFGIARPTLAHEFGQAPPFKTPVTTAHGSFTVESGFLYDSQEQQLKSAISNSINPELFEGYESRFDTFAQRAKEELTTDDDYRTELKLYSLLRFKSDQATREFTIGAESIFTLDGRLQQLELSTNAYEAPFFLSLGLKDVVISQLDNQNKNRLCEAFYSYRNNRLFWKDTWEEDRKGPRKWISSEFLQGSNYVSYSIDNNGRLILLQRYQ
jgi:hypothetical protein